MVEIKDIANVYSGITLRKKKNQKSERAYALIKLGDIDENHRLLTGELDSTKDIRPKGQHLLNSDNIIFGNKGEYNFATVIPENLGPAIAGSSFLILKNIVDDISPEFLAWYINSKEGQDYLSKVRKRTSIPYVSKTNFVEMPVEIPPLQTQKLIVKIDELKKSEKELLQSLQEKRKKLIDTTLLDHIKKSARKT